MKLTSPVVNTSCLYVTFPDTTGREPHPSVSTAASSSTTTHQRRRATSGDTRRLIVALLRQGDARRTSRRLHGTPGGGFASGKGVVGSPVVAERLPVVGQQGVPPRQAA